MKSYILCDVLQASFVSSRGFSGFVKNPAAAFQLIAGVSDDQNAIKFVYRLKILPSIFLSQASRLEES